MLYYSLVLHVLVVCNLYALCVVKFWLYCKQSRNPYVCLSLSLCLSLSMYTSGSRPVAPGARLPSDRLVLDPSALRPPGPAAPQAREQVADAGPEAPMAHVAASHLSPAQDEAHGEARAVAEGPAPATARRQRSGEANREEGRGEGSRGIRAFLGLGPRGVEPGSRVRPAVDVGRSGKPVKPKTKPAQGGPTGRKPRKPRTLLEASGDPRGHIHRWLGRGVTGGSTGHAGTPGGSREPQARTPGEGQPGSAGGTGPGSGPRRLPAVPGSSTDPPLGRPRPGPHGVLGPAPGGHGSDLRNPQAGGSDSPRGDRSSRGLQGSRDPMFPREAGADLEAGVSSEDEGTLPRVSFIPDFFAPPTPGGEGNRPSHLE